MNRQQDRSQGGFTLIELMLSMTFISVLLVAIAMCSIYVGTIYQRGLTLKEVNQSGRAIIKDVQSTINTSSPFDVTEGVAYIKSGTAATTKSYRLCTGTYSYLINSAAGLAASNPTTDGHVIKYDVTGGLRDGKLPRFVRANDTTQKYCRVVSGGVYPSISLADNPIDLLEGSDRNLAIHSITSLQRNASFSGSVTSSAQAVYTMTFILGTTEAGTIKTSDYTCQPPDNETNNFTYCAINEFTITARAGNEL